MNMTKREVIDSVLKGQTPPYVPWSCGFTKDAQVRLRGYYGPMDLETALDNHLLKLGSDIGFFTDLGNQRFEDVFGVIWDRSIDQDIGNVKGSRLSEPSLQHYTFPDPVNPRFFADIPSRIEKFGDRFRIYQLGFSLYERAWTLRGIQNLLMDFYDHPGFVHELLNTIADYNIAQVQQALTYDIDAVYFGDDWGQQHGLQMGPKLWREFLYPVLERMYTVVHQAGKYVFIHSCGDVDELFDDLIAMGVNCFNPLQPEVMPIGEILKKYRGRLTFHGGLSTQQTLPYGAAPDVALETQRLLELGSLGSYIFAPAHDVEGDVPLDNMLAFIEILQSQPGYPKTEEERKYDQPG